MFNNDGETTDFFIKATHVEDVLTAHNEHSHLLVQYKYVGY